MVLRWNRLWLRWHLWRRRRLAGRLAIHAIHVETRRNLIHDLEAKPLLSLVPNDDIQVEGFDEDVWLRAQTPVFATDMDAPDSPEADHLFWEQTAPELLEEGGVFRTEQPWRDDPLA